MEILCKKLGKGEVDWKGVVIPRHKKALFPSPGVQFDLSDGTATYKVKVDNQFRIRLAQWFRRHPAVKADDEVIFSEENKTMRITLSNNGSNRAWSTRELLGRETPKGKIIDIEYTPKGPVALLQRTERISLDKLLIDL